MSPLSGAGTQKGEKRKQRGSLWNEQAGNIHRVQTIHAASNCAGQDRALSRPRVAFRKVNGGKSWGGREYKAVHIA